MAANLTKSLRKLYYRFAPDHVWYENLPLPDKRLRTGGEEFQDDAYFLQSARHEAQRLVSHFSLTAEDNLLDVGCGFGRLAVGLLDTLPKLAYTGLDVNPVAIEWCQRHIETVHPSFQFVRLDVQNDRYNPEGQALDGRFRFPFSDNTFDIAYLYSVFSHMVQADVEIYLAELRRILNENGRLFFTAFAEKDVPDMTVNPANYRNIEWKSALHCVRYNVDSLQALLVQCGFQVDEFVYEQETNGQSAFYVSVAA